VSTSPSAATRAASVQTYIDAVPSPHRPTLARLMGVITELRPDLTPRLSYNMLCWKTGTNQLFVAAWKHGLSVYGWPQDRELALTQRHPELRIGKGTIRLTPTDAAEVTDDELLDLVRATLGEHRARA
jgi:uncharacterized protein YdhG (YjbR/CyaY superfamily)